MSRIGYGRSKEQILETVKSIIVKDGCPNTFNGGKLGRKWWRLYLENVIHNSLLGKQLARLSFLYNFAMVAVCLIDQCSVIFQKKTVLNA